MAEIILTKAANGTLVPVDQQAADYIAKLRLGAGISATVKKHNNPAFHNKMMALFRLGFDAWEPEEQTYKGEVVSKNFDQFRSDITVLAGFYNAHLNVRGETRLTAKSLNFSSMDQDEREQVYDAVINVLIKNVLKRHSREDIDVIMSKISGFM